MSSRKIKRKKEKNLQIQSLSINKKRVFDNILKNKIFIKLILILVLIIAIHGYLVKLNSPTTIANKYFIAIINEDENDLYKLMDLKEGKFTTIKMLKKVLKNNSVNDKNKEILKHKVKETKYNDENNASVIVEYLVKGLSKTQRMTIELNKSKTKKWLIYDNWKASTNKYSIAEDFEIKVQSGSIVEIENIKLDKTYLNKKKTTKNDDIYTIPVMYTGKYKIKAELSNGITTEELVNVNTKSSYSPSLSSQILEENSEKKLSKQALKDLQIIYDAAIDNKSFSKIKSKFEYKDCNLEKLEKSYNEFKNDLSKNNILTKIDFNEAVVGSIYTTEDKILNVSVTAKSKYTVKYEENGKKKKHSDKASDYVTLYYKIIDNEYKLVDVKYLETYFSRY